MKVWLHQCASPAGEVATAFAEIAAGLAGAKAAGAGMALFPELLLPGYNSDRVADLAEPLGGAWTGRLAAMAREAGVGITTGYAERDGAAAYNSAVCIGARGEVLANYRKLQLFGPREARLFRPGGGYVTFDWAGTRTALMICYDVEFAGHVRALAGQGVKLILCPTANMHPFTHVTRFTVPSQAVNHAVGIAYCNYCGVEGDLHYYGGSVAVAADGHILAEAGGEAEGLVADFGYRPDARLLSSQIADYRPA
ncbi:MAG: nitrilase-related carbon-nitrogen hydrolase [Paracoccaceae bacterium]